MNEKEEILFLTKNKTLINKFLEVLRSSTNHASTIVWLVEAYHRALKQKDERIKLKNDLKDLEKRIVQIELRKITMRRNRPLKHKLGSCMIIEPFQYTYK